MSRRIFAISLLISAAALWPAHASDRPGERVPAMRKEFRQAVDLYERGMYDRAATLFETVAASTGDHISYGYAVLCAAEMKTAGYESRLEKYISDFPYSGLIPPMRYRYGLNLFDANDYKAASEEFETVSRHHLYRSDVPEFLFKKAYCDFELGDYVRAELRFKELERRPYSEYTAPSRYALGYISYEQKRFDEAIKWFGESEKDPRFSQMSVYYMIECRFMLKDYGYMTSVAPSLIDKVPEERRSNVIRLISESYLVLGDAGKAGYYFDLNKESLSMKSRGDYFYAGSVRYALKDYKGAIENYSMMTERTDSIGQIANYYLGYSYIQTKNKVAALSAFKDAASSAYNGEMSEDAYFNYAKLAFDLNNDPSVFNDYLKKYSDVRKGDRINSYIAVAALYNRDYETAIEAYGKIDELDGAMKSNYMKSNYLRAAELIGESSYRDAVPCLKAAAYYSDKRGVFNQLARFWMAESYYRDDKFDDALAIYTELHNISALYGMDEGYLIPYNIAYCHFKKEDYPKAAGWFARYLEGSRTQYRKESLLRYADCLFMQASYRDATAAYGRVLKDYFDVNDIYPYYQSAIAYGLDGDNAMKISLLENVEKARPESQFYPEALYELGRSYVIEEKDEDAVRCFDRLIGTVKDSTFIAKAFIELGMIARNASEPEKALGYYKKVVEEMPLSGYADAALLAVESIYQSQNRPDDYLSYIDSIGKSSIKTEVEKEMMIFNAAEQIFLSENYRKALVSLQSYIDRYPAGMKVSQAEFYMAECYRSLGQRERACDYYAKVIDNGDGAFQELSMLNFANISFDLQRYTDALGGYSALLKTARLENNVDAARIGMMRSAFRARMYEDAITYAGEVKDDGRSDSDLKREASYVTAKSYLATSRRDEAFEILSGLSAMPSTDEGAEAAYLIITDFYDKGDFDSVENKVYGFSDADAGQPYWLAKSFILLGDSFVERGEIEQAKATFESIRDGYTPRPGGDEVLDNVRMRLEKLAGMQAAGAAQDTTAASNNL